MLRKSAKNCLGAREIFGVSTRTDEHGKDPTAWLDSMHEHAIDQPDGVRQLAWLRPTESLCQLIEVDLIRHKGWLAPTRSDMLQQSLGNSRVASFTTRVREDIKASCVGSDSMGGLHAAKQIHGTVSLATEAAGPDQCFHDSDVGCDIGLEELVVGLEGGLQVRRLALAQHGDAHDDASHSCASGRCFFLKLLPVGFFVWAASAGVKSNCRRLLLLLLLRGRKEGSQKTGRAQSREDRGA